MAVSIERGISMRELKRLWQQVGGEVQEVRRTGEVRFYYPPTGERSGMANNRRRDAPLRLVVFVRRIMERLRLPQS